MLPLYEFTDKKYLERIHEGSIEILEESGIRILNDDVLGKLYDAGFPVDFEEKKVKIPSAFILRALETCPKEFSLFGRKAENQILLKADGNIFTRSTGGPEFILNPETQQKEPLTLASVANYTKLIDALPNIKYVKNIWPNDVPFNVRDVHTVFIMLKNTGKHLIVQPYSAASLDYIVDIISLISDDNRRSIKKPLVSFYISITSPLQFDKESIEMLIKAGECRIPILMNSTPLAGGTCPVTIAGMVVLINAEILAGITIHQHFNPGSPIIYTPRPYIFDMNTGICAHGYIENSLASIILVHLVKSMYKIPIEILGPATDSKTVNLQSILERVFLTFVPCFAYPNLIAGAGNLESSSLVSPIQLIIDNEIFGIMYRAIHGVEVSDNTLAVDLIKEMGSGASYLQSDHTFLNFRKELYLSNFLDREFREIWESKGERDLTDTALSIYKKIMASHEPPPLEHDKEVEITKLIKCAEKEL